MSDESFDLEAWLRRLGYAGSCAPTLPTLRAIVAAQCATVPYENIDVLLGRPPRLDLGSLQRKMVAGGRGGYCFEQNLLLRAGLRALGFRVQGLIARVVRGMPADAPRPSGHMVLQVDLPEGPFLADVGFGNLTPTAPLARRADVEQTTPHETMRLSPAGGELVLQVRLDDGWENLWRLCAHLPLDADYEVANWFTATHPDSIFTNNLIAARPGNGGRRHTLLNGWMSVRLADGRAERRMLESDADFDAALNLTFGLVLAGVDLRVCERMPVSVRNRPKTQAITTGVLSQVRLLFTL